MGCVIENRQERENGGSPGEEREVLSWYRLLKEPRDVAEEL
ncbi:MAG TPA: hypothetical protein VK615_05880 [Candidatus Binatia bacterium]|nr:hypothetical protein [Candidatus Binatia bacterium]